MSLILTDVQKVSVAVSFTTKAGNPAPVDGVPQWSSSDPSILEVVPSADGLSAEVLTVGPLGLAQVSVVADADLGEGVTSITGVLDVEVKASQAVFAIVAAGAPVDK